MVRGHLHHQILSPPPRLKTAQVTETREVTLSPDIIGLTMTTNQNVQTLSGEEFVTMLAEENRSTLERLGQLSASGDAPDTLTVERLLLVALKNELEAAEVAALWMGTTSELDVKLALARQVGDEAKHYRLISERLGGLGVDASLIDPREGATPRCSNT